MRYTALLSIILWLPLPTAASHTWSGIDLCEIYKDRLPPGLTLESLPDPRSPGARLLHRYCTQCHNLPGPDRHTVAEWRELIPKMFLLMDVSHRFGGLMGQVEVLKSREQEVVLAYLERYAMQPADREETAAVEQSAHPWPTRVSALLPFLLLTGLGLLRWWRYRRRERA